LNYKLLLVFGLWCAACAVLFFGAVIFTQLGDCFEVRECVSFKSRSMIAILLGIPAIWLIGSVTLVKRWTK
jgi:hypothetical protein